MPGIGTMPVGLGSPFGLGTPDDATPPPPGGQLGARYLDPVSKDYAVGPDGEYLRMPTLRQRVLLAIGTVLDSSSVQQTVGMRLPDRVDSNFERRVQFSVKSALASLVSAGELRIDSVSVALPIPGRALITVAYTNLLTGESDSATQ